MIKEFKEFIAQGNVIDLAIGVVIGSTFGAIVNAIVGGLIMPVVQIFTGSDGLDGITWVVAGATFEIGLVLQAILEFFIIALVLFAVVKAMNKMKKPVEVVEEAAPVVSEEVVLLREIRDSLNK